MRQAGSNIDWNVRAWQHPPYQQPVPQPGCEVGGQGFCFHHIFKNIFWAQQNLGATAPKFPPWLRARQQPNDRTHHDLKLNFGSFSQVPRKKVALVKHVPFTWLFSQSSATHRTKQWWLLFKQRTLLSHRFVRWTLDRDFSVVPHFKPKFLAIFSPLQP